MSTRPRTARALTLIAAVAAVGAPARAGAEEPPLPPDSRAALAASRVACERGEPTCDRTLLLSGLERRAVERVVAARGLVIARAPYGKRVRRIIVANQQVFGPGDGVLQWLNVFHWTSKEDVVEREIVLRPGARWDDRLADESLRRLRDPIFTTLAAIVAVETDAADAVDLLVVTRDVWSLRMNTQYEIQERTLTRLSFAFSENNVFGRRKLLALSFRLDQGAYTLGPLFIDKNMFGRHIDVRATGGPVFNRQTRELEGSQSSIDVARPLWNLDREWGVGLDFSHRFLIERSFLGTVLRTYDAPETPVDDMLPWRYQQRRIGVAAAVVRGFGHRVEHRLRGGYELVSQRPSLLADFPPDPLLAQSFIENVLPRSERTSALFAGYSLFEPRYRNFQNVGTYDLAEDVQLGAEAETRVTTGLELIGSESDFVRLSAAAGYTGTFGGDGLWRARVSATTRLEGGEANDNIVDGRLRFVSPSFELGRLVTQVRAAALWRDTQNQFYTVGGDDGLRGFAIGEFSGDRLLTWQTDLRSPPLPIWFTRVGVVAFYDVGGAAASFAALPLHHDVGVGVRSLVPQLDRGVYRFDFAVALDGDRRGQVRFIGGFDQAF